MTREEFGELWAKVSIFGIVYNEAEVFIIGDKQNLFTKKFCIVTLEDFLDKLSSDECVSSHDFIWINQVPFEWMSMLNELIDNMNRAYATEYYKELEGEEE